MQESSDFFTSPGNVDMRNGGYNYRNVDLTIGGEGDSGLALVRSLQLNTLASIPLAQFTHNWNIQLHEERQEWCGAYSPGDWDYVETVVFEGHEETFFAYGGGTNLVFVQTAPKSFAKLEKSNGEYVLTSSDGTIVKFLQMQSWGINSPCQAVSRNSCTYAYEVIRPDGTTYSLDYETLSDGHTRRLKSVMSSRGLALLFEHTGSNSTTVAKACAINLAQQVMPSNGLCPSGIPTSEYTYANGVQTQAVEAGGGTWKFALGSSTFSFWRPGDGATPFVVNDYHLVGGTGDRQMLNVVDHQQFIDGRTIDYDWDIHTNNYVVYVYADNTEVRTSQIILGGTWDDGHGDTVELVFGRYTDPLQIYPNGNLHASIGPEIITDQIGRETHFKFCTAAWETSCTRGVPLQSIEAPEGSLRSFGYDWAWRVDQTATLSKDGLSSLVTSSTFPNQTGCVAAMKACNKPLSTTDAKGNVTNYTYDPTHGGLLTQSGPAVGGVPPRTKYSYMQRSAWIKNAGGGYSQAATPVWVLTEERSCRTSTLNLSTGACSAGSSDLVRTTYDYGPNSGPNNLWLRGVAVIADGQTLRTCYRYDGYGRRISETSPNANLTSCP